MTVEEQLKEDTKAESAHKIKFPISETKII